MIITIRDTNLAFIEACQLAFAGTQVQASCGDIFQIQADGLVSPANSFGWMDGGIDGIYRWKYGMQLEANVQKRIREEFGGELPVGKAFIVPIESDFHRNLIVAPTMRTPGPVPNTQNAYLAMKAALRVALDESLASFVTPGLGTLTGRIPPVEAARQMKQAYSEIFLPQLEDRYE